MGRIPTAALLLIAALGLASCASLARRDSSSSASPETLLNPPTRVASRADRVEVAGRHLPGVRDIGVQAWLLAVPPGELALEFRTVELRNAATGEIVVVRDREALAELANAGLGDGPIALADLGVMRRVRLAALRIDASRSVTWRSARWTPRAVDAVVRFPRWTRESVADSAFVDPSSSLRRMLELSVANRDGIDRYAQAAPERPDPAPAQEWQPRPELSPGQPWLRIPVASDGLYAIDGRWLADRGLAATDLHPGDLRIVSRGREVVTVATGIDGAAFAGGARLLFPALASDSPETAERVYYVGRRSAPAAASATAPRFDDAPIRRSHPRRWRIERDEKLQTRVGNFLSIREMAWVWDRLAPGDSRTFSFDLPALPLPAPSAKSRIVLYISGSGRIGEATARVSINGHAVGGEFSLSGEDAEIAFDIPANLLRREGNEAAVAWSEANPSAAAWLDAIEFEFESLFRADAGAHLADFSQDADAFGPARIEVVGFRPYRVVAVDVADPDNPVRLPVDVAGDAALVHADLSPATRIRIVEDDTVPRAPEAEPSVWRDWLRRDHSADGVIVHHARFAAQAERLAAMWRADGRETLVVDVDSVFEAYTFGEISSDAIRRFLQAAANDWTGRRPAHALLLGDCTSDGRNVSRSGVENLLPTHVVREGRRGTGDEYAADAYYSWLAGNDEIADLLVGRISVNSEEDARAVVDKIAAYRALRADRWTSRIASFSDAEAFADASREMVAAGCSSNVDALVLSTADVPWEDNFYLPEEATTDEDAKVSPVFTQRIENVLNEGAAIVAWTGHGSPNLWSNQRVWFGGDSDNSDSLRLANRDRLPFVAAFTCNNGAIDYPTPRWNITILEDMMRLPDGGAIACFAPTGPGFPSRHKRLGEGLLRAATILGEREFGAISEMARLNFQATLGPEAHTRMYLLLGDPTLRLPAPAFAPPVVVSPDRFADSREPQKFAVSVQSAADSIGNTAELVDANGNVLATAPMDADLAARLTCVVPPDAERLRIVARGRNATGEPWQSGVFLPRATAEVVVETASGDERSERVRFALSNRSEIPARASLVARILPGTGEDDRFELPVEIEPFGSANVALPLPADGKFLAVDASIAPSARRRELIVRSSPTTPFDLALLPEAVEWSPPSGGAKVPRWTVRVANGGAQVASVAVDWILTAADGTTETGRTAAENVSPGKTGSAVVVARSGIDPAQGATLRVAAILLNGDDADPSDNEVHWRCDPASLADLAVRADSVRVSPAHLAEGATIFVDAVLENIGAAESPACRIALHAAEDADLKSALVNMAGREAVDVPPLAPAATWPVRLRWDPVGNRAVESIVFAVDPEATILEAARDNNRVAVPLDIRTKWRLAARGITARPHDDASILLVARVANLGQTDARRVAVQFYADEDQTPANLVGETVVDVVPAQGEVDAEFLWDVRGWDLKKARRPSFVIAIKGSLQRTSSVTQ